uniref:Uncharacterized protein n=1 Tax=Anguilla anguilla TaxID=7936 RepID=A0A0E9UJL7_ANGAN
MKNQYGIHDMCRPLFMCISQVYEMTVCIFYAKSCSCD